MTTIKAKPFKGIGVSSVLETLNRVRDRDGLAAAREAAREMVIERIADRRLKFNALVACAIVLEVDD